MTDAATAGTRDAVWRWTGLILVSVITFILVRLAVLNTFFTFGDMHDPGWLASVTWHNGWRLHGPKGFPGPFFSEHLMLLMWLTNAVSFVVPMDRYEYYAACIGLTHALFAAGVWRAWLLTETRVTASRAGIGVLVALAATFSAVAIIALGLPHPELAIPALGLWFVIAMARRSYGQATFWFLACLAAREDAGFHLFGLLILWAGVVWWRASVGEAASRRDVKWLLGFAAAAFGYSLLAFLVKRVEFPAGDILWRSYLGIPPFHHVTWSFVLNRLRFWSTQRTYVTLPLVICLIWAATSRNLLLPLGYIAAVPWLLLSILAVHETPGNLAYYYGFPFWLALAWPLVALYDQREGSGRPAARWPYALLLLVSLVGWNGMSLTVYPLDRGGTTDYRLAYNNPVRDRAVYRMFTDYFNANKALFGATALDQAVFGLMIDKADRSSWLETWPSDHPPETMIYFFPGFDYPARVLPLLRTGAYRCFYAVPATKIRIATQNPLSEDLPLPTPIMLIAQLPGAQC